MVKLDCIVLDMVLTTEITPPWNEAVLFSKFTVSIKPL
jgi:hypothetical protein